MNCKEIQAKLIDWLDGSLDADTAAIIAEHVTACEECSREAMELKELLATMKDSPLEVPPAVLRESFDTMLQSELNMLTTANIIQEFPAEGQDNQGKSGQDKSGHGSSLSGQGGLSGRPGKIIRLPFAAPVWRVAAAIILLAGGIGIGAALKSRPAPEPSTNETLAALRQEVKEMKEEVMLNMIDDESASQRIKAVSYAEDMPSPNQEVIDVLVNTLNRDKNVNVRLAALYSLQRFADRRAVRDSLVNSLRNQTEPIIQVVLINLLAEKRDARAIKPIQDIMTDKKTLKEVKDAAQRSLKSF
jgi:Putative zinc-finger